VGFIHLINENEFDIAAATIVDVGFLGLFPKAILQCIYKYANQMEKTKHDKEHYMSLVNDLITAFVYRRIVMQKVIHIMLSKQKSKIENGRQVGELPIHNDDFTEYTTTIEPAWIYQLLLPICLLLLLYNGYVTLINAGYLKRKGSSDDLCFVLEIRLCAQGA